MGPSIGLYIGPHLGSTGPYIGSTGPNIGPHLGPYISPSIGPWGRGSWFTVAVLLADLKVTVYGDFASAVATLERVTHGLHGVALVEVLAARAAYSAVGAAWSEDVDLMLIGSLFI